jgi:hypothetical protein
MPHLDTGTCTRVSWPLLLLQLAGAQQQQQPGTDTEALLAFKQNGNAANRWLDSWTTAGSGPCGEDYNHDSSGWWRVQCDRSGGRVISLHAYDIGLAGSVALLAPLTELRSISLWSNRALTGDVSSLRWLVQLRDLRLDDTAVFGELSTLASLPRLGETWETSGGRTGGVGALHLANSAVYGDVRELRALPGLRASWGPGGDGDSWDTFSSCARYRCSSCDRSCSGSCQSTLQSIGETRCVQLEGLWDAADIAGRDECACCAATPLIRDLDTGACSIRPCETVDAFSSYSTEVTAACCGGGGISRSKTEAAAPSTCVDGLPTVCGHSCGAAVMLMQRVCATIAGSIGGGVGDAVEAAATLCGGTGH